MPLHHLACPRTEEAAAKRGEYGNERYERQDFQKKVSARCIASLICGERFRALYHNQSPSPQADQAPLMNVCLGWAVFRPGSRVLSRHEGGVVGFHRCGAAGGGCDGGASDCVSSGGLQEERRVVKAQLVSLKRERWLTTGTSTSRRTCSKRLSVPCRGSLQGSRCEGSGTTSNKLRSSGPLLSANSPSTSPPRCPRIDGAIRSSSVAALVLYRENYAGMLVAR